MNEITSRKLKEQAVITWLKRAEELDTKFDSLIDSAEMTCINIQIKANKMTAEEETINAIEVYFLKQICAPLKATVEEIKKNVEKTKMMLMLKEQEDSLEKLKVLLKNEKELLKRIKKLEWTAHIVIINLEIQNAFFHKLESEIKQIESIVNSLTSIYEAAEENMGRIENVLF